MATIKTSELSGAALDYAVAQCEGESLAPQYWHLYNYSSDWSQAGTIIEREGIGLTQFSCYPQWTAKHYKSVCYDGHTPLIAAMRCYVASRMGDNVEIPDSLVSLIVKG